MDWDWKNIPDDSVRELLRQAELLLDNTLRVAVAADQRAVMLAGVFGGAAVALLAAVAAVLSGTAPRMPLVAAGGTSAVLFLAAALACAVSAQPARFHVGGYEPRKLIASASDHVWILRYVCEQTQDDITFNRGALDRAAAWVRAGLWLGLAAALAGPAAFLVSWGLARPW